MLPKFVTLTKIKKIILCFKTEYKDRIFKFKNGQSSNFFSGGDKDSSKQVQSYYAPNTQGDKT